MQVVVYSTADNPNPPGPTAGDNFVPYGDSFLPDTTAPGSGHSIIYTGSLTGNTNDGFRFMTFVEVPSIYDKVYLRVFDATGWELGIPKESAWGISSVNDITDDGAGMGFTWWGNIPLTNMDYFEVIPEPGTMALLGIGAVGLAGWSRRRKGTRRNQAGETGAEEP